MPTAQIALPALGQILPSVSSHFPHPLAISPWPDSTIDLSKASRSPFVILHPHAMQEWTKNLEDKAASTMESEKSGKHRLDMGDMLYS